MLMLSIGLEALTTLGNRHTSSLRREMESLYQQNPVPAGMGALAFLLILFGFFRDSLFLKQARDTGLTAVLNVHGDRITYMAFDHSPLWNLLHPDRRSHSGRMDSVIFQTYHIIGILHYLPLQDLYSFSGWKVTCSRQRETRQKLTAWASENGDSARTVALHAGRLFSHCRSRLSPHGYQDPRAILIASLALWVYSSSMASASLQGPFGRCLPSADHSSCQHKSIITLRLDRAFDDWRTAQDWVRNGCHYRGFISGLGSINGSNMYPLIVTQAINLLVALQGWSLSGMLANELGRLVGCFETNTSGQLNDN